MPEGDDSSPLRVGAAFLPNLDPHCPRSTPGIRTIGHYNEQFFRFNDAAGLPPNRQIPIAHAARYGNRFATSPRFPPLRLVQRLPNAIVLYAIPTQGRHRTTLNTSSLSYPFFDPENYPQVSVILELLNGPQCPCKHC